MPETQPLGAARLRDFRKMRSKSAAPMPIPAALTWMPSSPWTLKALMPMPDSGGECLAA